MTQSSSVFRAYAARITAAVVVLAIYGFARLPALSTAERNEIVSRFSFSRLPLPAPQSAAQTPFRSVRNVHPDMARIAGWISSVGAAVALNDLDGDGLSNDVCYVDPRTDLVTVAPVPGTPDRYKPFVLDPAPLPFDPSTMAPMGCLPGDFNEDGLIDVLVYYWGRTPVIFFQIAD